MEKKNKIKFKKQYQQLNLDQRKAVKHFKGPAICQSPPGSGKCLHPDTPVLMFNGKIKKAKDVKVGDFLMGPDSEPRKVKALGSGYDTMYEVIPVKGESFICNSEHILSLRTNHDDKTSKKGDITNIPINKYLKKDHRYKHHKKLYRVGVDFPARKTHIDPYFLGIWLGDGSREGTAITTMEPEVVSYIKKKIFPRYNLKFGFINDCGKAKIYNLICRNAGESNYLTHIFKYYKLNIAKYIPRRYKVNSRENRLALLAGLIDADGYLSNGVYDFISKYKKLANDVVFVARSLGLAAYIKPSEKGCWYKGEYKSAIYWRVSISGNLDMIPCIVPRRKAPPRKQIKNVLHTGIKQIKNLGRGKYNGFEISGDGLFLLGDFTVTHNTKTIITRVGYLITYKNIDPAKILVCTFTRKAAGEMSERLLPIIGKAALSKLNIGTMHSIFFNKFLRPNAKKIFNSQNVDILKEWKKRSMIKDIVTYGKLDLDIPTLDKEIGFAKNAGVINKAEFKQHRVDRGDKIWLAEIKSNVFETFEHNKKRDCVLDFDDMLTLTYQLWKDNPDILGYSQRMFDYIFVDEFQDTSTIQYWLLKMLAEKHKNIFVVCDVFQSLYQFRAANPQVTLDFRKDFEPVSVYYNLVGYRCPTKVIDSANKLAAIQNKLGGLWDIVSPLKPNKTEPGLIEYHQVLTEQEEAIQICELVSKLKNDEVPLHDIAILYRVNSISGLIETKLLKAGIPFFVYGGISFWARKEVQDILGYLTLAYGHGDRAKQNEAYERIYNKPNRFLGKAYLDQLKQNADSRDEDLLSASLNTRFSRPYMGENARSLNYLIMGIRDFVQKAKNVGDVVAYTRDATGYDQWLLKDEGQDTENDRVNNLVVFQEAATGYKKLDELLEFADKARDAEEEKFKDDKIPKNKVQLMSGHRCKGLEFNHVIIAGFAQNIIPHALVPEKENERCIAYVLITRSKENLYIYTPMSRFGKPTGVSEFLYEAGIVERPEVKLLPATIPTPTETTTTPLKVEAAAQV